MTFKIFVNQGFDDFFSCVNYNKESQYDTEILYSFDFSLTTKV